MFNRAKIATNTNLSLLFCTYLQMTTYSYNFTIKIAFGCNLFCGTEFIKSVPQQWNYI